MLLAAAVPVAVLAQAGANAQGGDPDPAFAVVPFDKWLAANNAPQIKWEARVNPAALSMEQRLRVRVDVQVDGDEVAKRKGRGQLVTLVRFQDGEGRAYESHSIIDLKAVQQATNKLNFVISQDAYVLPGDYQVSLGVLDTTTGDHSVARRALHVNPLKNDPLLMSWRDLPPVEIVTNQPFHTRKINLPLESKRPVRLELLVNMSPSLETPGLRTRPIPPETVLNGLATVLRVLSQMEVRNGTFHVETLDLTRRKVILEQEIRPPQEEMDWEKLGEALKDADPNIIDVGSLKNRGHGVEFFDRQVRRGIGDGEESASAGNPQRVLIVLTPPFSFGSGEEVRPIELETPTNARVYYLRRHSLPPVPPVGPIYDDRRYNRNRRIDMPIPARGGYAEPLDSLDRILKPLKPKTFDIYTAEDLRKALASIIEDINRL
jgi:hypothetical protein